MTRDLDALRRVAYIDDCSERFGSCPHSLDRLGTHEVDGRAAESAAGQPCTETPWDIPNRSGESVELSGDDLEVVSHAAVRIVHERAQGCKIVDAESLGRGNRSLVLRDDVTGSPT
jgi:hypothetical protein